MENQLSIFFKNFVTSSFSSRFTSFLNDTKNILFFSENASGDSQVKLDFSILDSLNHFKIVFSFSISPNISADVLFSKDQIILEFEEYRSNVVQKEIFTLYEEFESFFMHKFILNNVMKHIGFYLSDSIEKYSDLTMLKLEFYDSGNYQNELFTLKVSNFESHSSLTIPIFSDEVTKQIYTIDIENDPSLENKMYFYSSEHFYLFFSNIVTDFFDIEP